MTSERRTRPRVAAVVPAKDEAARLPATLAALHTLDLVDLVVVVDDGSSDGTSLVAVEGGAVVVRHSRNRGKAAALASGAAEVARLDDLQEDGPEGPAGPRALLFVDADLEDSAGSLGPLCVPVLAGDADMTIAVLPPQLRRGGGFGLVVRMASTGIARLTGWTPTQPLSGMRCLSRDAWQGALPLAGGWGVEVGLTVDVLRAGGRVVEVPCELHHRVTGRDLRSQVHRGRQYRDAWWALARRGAWRPSRAGGSADDQPPRQGPPGAAGADRSDADPDRS